MHDGSPHRDALRLDRVVLRGAEGACPDPLRARLRLERTLATTDWTPAGLPPGALLFVRRLRVQGPGFATGGGDSPIGRDPFADDRVFASRIADALRAQGRAARRPWSDALAVDADAVWFEDEHELAACLIRDWLRGLVAQRWWWRSVLAGAGIDAWLRSELLPRGERLAPTLQRLATVSLADAWLARMDDADARAGFDALARAYALPPARVEDVDATRDRNDDPDQQEASTRRPARRTSSVQAAARRRLQRIVPELGAMTWRPAQARLLAYGLAVLRAPAEACTRAFADDVAAWRPVQDRAREDIPADDAIESGIVEAVDADRVRDDASRTQPSQARATSSTHPTLAAATRADTETAGPAAGDASRQHPASSAEVASTPASGVTPAAKGIDAGDRQASLAAVASSADIAMSSALELPLPTQDVSPAMTDAEIVGETAPVAMPVAVSRTLSTRHGGLFYVLNAALALGVYGDFTAPRTQGIPLSPWDLLAWLGLHWFGRAFRRDPLWRLLADLSGRSPKRAPSWRIDPPSQWAPEDDWLRAWSPIVMLDHGVDRRARRLQVRHPDGFAVFDVPRDTRLRPAAQARALCLARGCASRARLQPTASTSTSTKTRRLRTLPADPGARWLHCFAGYLAARFMRALGATSPRAAVALLCRHAAEVRCDASRVEIALSLSSLPLPVRIAGLDRDPGWIPAAGRDVRFHFS